MLGTAPAPRGRRRVAPRWTWLALIALLLAAAPGAEIPAAPASPSAKVGPEVFEALRTQGAAQIVIALAEPASLQAAPPNLDQLRRDVAAVQDRALAAVDATEYRPRLRFAAVPALAGTALSAAGVLRLAAQPDVVRIDLDIGGAGGLTASVPFIGATQWHAQAIRGDGVLVAVLDSGVDTDHPNLADDLVAQACFLDNGGTINGAGLCPNGSDRQLGAGAAEDDAGHGTHVSGIITSNGSAGAPGAAPGAEIVAVKVLAGPSFSGVFYAFSEIVAALDYLITDQPAVKVINMSLGTSALFAGDCDTSTSFNIAGAAAINTLRARGTIAFASSGNNGSSTQMSSPACLSNVIAVGSVNTSDVIATSANTNAATDILAPGVGILSSAIGGGTVGASGTSMASPHAAGCAALLIQSGEATTPAAIEARLESSPFQITDPSNGRTYPRIDCRPRPPTSVLIAGPTAGDAGTPYSFTAETTPLTVTLPLGYTWEATDLGVITRTAGLSDTIDLSWSAHGTKTITVTVANAGGLASATHTITIAAAAPITVTLAGPTAGGLGIAHTFTASAAPPVGTAPLTYTWEVSDYGVITRTAGLSDTLAFTWPTPGPKTITITIANAAGEVRRTFEVVIDRRIYLPVIGGS